MTAIKFRTILLVGVCMLALACQTTLAAHGGGGGGGGNHGGGGYRGGYWGGGRGYVGGGYWGPGYYPYYYPFAAGALLGSAIPNALASKYVTANYLCDAEHSNWYNGHCYQNCPRDHVFSQGVCMHESVST
jgi:hypothetical protein